MHEGVGVCAGASRIAGWKDGLPCSSNNRWRLYSLLQVHESRADTCIRQAREERQLKRANAPVQVPNSNTSPAAFTAALSLVAGCMLWRAYDEQLRRVQWSQLPIIKQVRCWAGAHVVKQGL